MFVAKIPQKTPTKWNPSAFLTVLTKKPPQTGRKPKTPFLSYKSHFWCRFYCFCLYLVFLISLPEFFCRFGCFGRLGTLFIRFLIFFRFFFVFFVRFRRLCDYQRFPHKCPRLPQDSPRLPTIAHDCPRLPTITHDCPRLPHDCPNCLKLTNRIKGQIKLRKTIQNNKNDQNCEKRFKKHPKTAKTTKILTKWSIAPKADKNTKMGLQKCYLCERNGVFRFRLVWGDFFAKSCWKFKGIPFVWYLVSYLPTNAKEDCFFRLLDHRLRPWAPFNAFIVRLGSISRTNTANAPKKLWIKFRDKIPMQGYKTTRKRGQQIMSF